MPLIPWLAAKTTKVRIGMSIIDTPYRSPGVLAAELATIDHLSNGRLKSGVGSGWMPEEFAASSATHIFPKRHKHVRETIEIMQGIWTNDSSSTTASSPTSNGAGSERSPCSSRTRRSTSAGSRTRSVRRCASRSTAWRAGSGSRTRPRRSAVARRHPARARGARDLPLGRRSRHLQHDLDRHHRPGDRPDAERQAHQPDGGPPRRSPTTSSGTRRPG